MKLVGTCIVLIALLFSVNACSSKRRVVAVQKSFPIWYENPKKSTSNTLYAVAEGENKSDAVANALNEIVSTLSISISSEFNTKSVVKEGIVDPLATEFIRTLRIDIAFLTGGGISAQHGLSSATPEGAIFQRTVAQISRRKICLANFDKIGTEFFSKTLDIKDLDLVITDWEAPEEEVKKIQKEVKVLIAQK